MFSGSLSGLVFPVPLCCFSPSRYLTQTSSQDQQKGVRESGLCGYLMLIWRNHGGGFLFVCFLALLLARLALFDIKWGQER